MSNLEWRTCPACGRHTLVDGDRFGEVRVVFCDVCLDPRSLLNVIRAGASRQEVRPERPVEFGRCDTFDERGAHVSRPVLVRRLSAEAALVRCAGRTRRGRTCQQEFVMFDGVRGGIG